MKLVTDRPLVKIILPKIIVDSEFADEFLKMATTFFSNVKMEQIDQQCGQILYDTRYCEGEFIPVVQFKDSYEGFFNDIIDVEQVEKYIEIEKEDGQLQGSQIAEFWRTNTTEEE